MTYACDVPLGPFVRRNSFVAASPDQSQIYPVSDEE